jgi:hypothetical protein
MSSEMYDSRSAPSLSFREDLGPEAEDQPLLEAVTRKRPVTDWKH